MPEYGTEITQNFELPIWCYSKEAQKALNKEIRKARMNPTAKISRINVMKGQIHNLFQQSESVISSMMFKNKMIKNVEPFSKNVKDLLKE